MSLSSVPRRSSIRMRSSSSRSIASARHVRPDGGGGGGSAANTRPHEARQGAIATAAPDSFKVAVETNKGNFTIMAHRDWAPSASIDSTTSCSSVTSTTRASSEC